MARRRHPRPWLHQKSGYWCTSQNGKRIYLDRDYKVACRKLREWLADQEREKQGGTEWSDVPFSDLCDEFLDDVKARKKPATHQSYRYRLLRALQVLGTSLRVCDVSKHHLAKIEGALTKSHSPTSVKDTIATVQTVFSWAVKHDLIHENPLVGYEKPRGRVRTRVITPAEFQSLLRHADPGFRKVLIALRFTGCRPVEIRTLVWDWVNLDDGFWILPDHKTITRQRNPQPRLIPLPDPVWKLCRVMKSRADGETEHVFLNGHDGAYSKDCFCRKFARLRKRAGITVKAGEQLVLYSNRHTFGTVTAGKVSDMELAELMGHTDIRTTQRYVHFNAERLREIQRRAQK